MGDTVDSDASRLVVDDLSELVALDKALREAKFSQMPRDPAIAMSPIVADLSRRVRGALNLRLLGAPDPAEREGQIRPTWPEWRSSIQRAQESDQWRTWTRARKLDVARDLLSPFGVADELLQEFVDAVDRFDAHPDRTPPSD